MPSSRKPAPARASAPGKVRIIAGRLRGSKIEVAANPGLRPSPERLRETLFNWLQARIEGARCLDLFAGSGVLGIEAASRGAAFVVLVESDPGLAARIEANRQRLGVLGRVHCQDALRFLDSPAEPFDLVFVDPPFAAGHWSLVAQKLEQQGFLADNGLIYLETPSAGEIAVPSNWSLLKQAKVSSVRGLLYQRRARLR